MATARALLLLSLGAGALANGAAEGRKAAAPALTNTALERFVAGGSARALGQLVMCVKRGSRWWKGRGEGKGGREGLFGRGKRMRKSGRCVEEVEADM